MKLGRITNTVKSAERWYDDACGTALAMELVGERWSLLIVRELMFGGRRFSELRASLRGISANVLTQRLEGLERSDILHRRTLPSPANVQVYELTEWGYESERAIQELGRWAVRSPRHDPTLPLSAASLMMSFRTMFDAKLAEDLSGTIGMVLGPRESFAVTVTPYALTVARADAPESDVSLSSDPMTLASIVYGGRPIESAAADGVLSLSGDTELLRRFARCFPLPAKIGETSSPLL